tara:strand:- start:3114 stop:3785 length:672 start_codon:yes stop_codon:yes gene_type:complete
MDNPSYYAIIPANVRYANIKPNAKLLYGEITALSNQKGYCWSSNNYFAELYGVSKNTISLWINQLKKHGFIHVEVIRDQNKQVIKRTMTIIKNDDRSPIFKEQGVITNGESNIIKNNTTMNILSLRKMKFGSEVSDESQGILSVDQANEFLEYWTEETKSKTNPRMKFELERTWNTKKRLLRWKNNNEKWNKKSPGSSRSKIQNSVDEWIKAKDFIKKQQSCK